MKTYRNLAIICSLFLLLFIGSLGYVICLDQKVNDQIEIAQTYIPYQESSLTPLNTITEQSTDERGLISIRFSRDGKYWMREGMSKTDYDSLFCNYVNFKL